MKKQFSVLIACLLLMGGATAEPPDSFCGPVGSGGDGQTGIAVYNPPVGDNPPPPGMCNSEAIPNAATLFRESMCWRTPADADFDGGPPQQVPQGRDGLNLDLWFGVAPGDYAPKHREITASASPLVAREVAYIPGPSPMDERAVLEDAVDLVTGVPLLQEVDFELPFGSSVFRHVRTYSEVPSFGTAWPEFDLPSTHKRTGSIPERLFWDWHGQGWMMGESPILLIDAAYAGWQNTGSRRCYFIPDAHHAIPFVFDPLNGTWVAPARCDAILSQSGGQWDATGGRWVTPPTTFYVWLHHQSVKYTIDARYDDVYHDVFYDGTTSLDPGPLERPGKHDIPHDPIANNLYAGMGIPYFGVVRQIEDRYGNAIRLNYASTHRQRDCDDHTAWPEGTSYTHDCTECCPQCTEKGQIRNAELLTGVDPGTGLGGQVQWTLLYTYRTFEGAGRPVTDAAPYDDSQYYFSHQRQRAVHSIHVYRGLPPGLTQQSLESDTSSRTIGGREFWKKNRAVWAAGVPSDVSQQVTDSWEILAAITAIDSEAPTAPVVPLENLAWTPVPAGWEYETKYLYSDNSAVFEQTQRATDRLVGVKGDDQGYLEDYTPYLLMSTVKHRAPGGDGPVSTRHSIYRYRYAGNGGDSYGQRYYLSGIYEPGVLEGMRENLRHGSVEQRKLLVDWPVRLLYCTDQDTIPRRGASGSSAYTDAPFELFASQRFFKWDQGVGNPFIAPRDPFGDSAMHHEMLDDYARVAHGKFVHIPDGETAYARRVSDDADRVYRVYRFMASPEDRWKLQIEGEGRDNPYPTAMGNGNKNAPGAIGWLPLRSMYHEPYLYVGHDPSDYEPGVDWTQIESNPSYAIANDTATWLTVIDEYKNDLDANVAYEQGVRQQGSGRQLPVSRRVVQLNRSGFVLLDKTWNFESGATAQSGAAEQFAYDTQNRLVKHGSIGWGSAWNENAHESGSRGLVEVFHYDDWDDSAGVHHYPREIGASGIASGWDDAGPRVWLKQWLRDHERSEQVLAEVTFFDGLVQAVPLDYASLASVPFAQAGRFLKRTEVAYRENDRKKGLLWRRSIEEPTFVSPTSSALYPIEADTFDEHGNVVWHGRGMLADPLSGSSGSNLDERIFLAYTRYDTFGRVLDSVVDAGVGHLITDGESVPDPLMDSSAAALHLTRCAPTPALNYTTSYKYDSYGLSQTRYPNGRYTVTTHTPRWSGDEVVEAQRTYRDLVLRGDQIYAIGPGEEMLLVGERMMGGTMVRWLSLPAFGGGDWLSVNGAETTEAVSAVSVSYDANGSMIGLAQTGEDGAPILEAKAQIGRFGEVERRIEPDGTLTRTVSNWLGYTDRVYRGTKDKHVFWGTAPPGGPFDDDLLLTEKRYYGEADSPSSVRNCRKLVAIRRYQDVLTPRYPGVNETNAQDTTGMVEAHEYDWRMRDVCVVRGSGGLKQSLEHSDSLAHPFTTTLTFLDASGRVRAVAVYEGDPPSGAPDPRTLGMLDALPTAQQIWATHPLKLSETVYDSRGNVKESRQYDTSSTASVTDYLTSVTYFDPAGHPTWSRGSGNEVEVHEYDALGRMVESRTLAQGIEVQRKEMQLDTDGNAVRVVSFERATDSTSAVLTAQNSVRSVVFNWYDAKSRLIASADLGTRMWGASTGSDVGDRFVSRRDLADVPERPGSAGVCPVVVMSAETPGRLIGIRTDVLPPGARVTASEFNDQGWQTRSVAANGAVTVNVHDAIGRVLFKVENAPVGGNTGPCRITASRYEKGKLVATANVNTDPSSEFLAGQLSAAPVIDWNGTSDSTIQISHFFYGGRVVDSAYQSSGSRLMSGVAGVRFPGNAILTGGGEEPADLRFQYFPDGSLASRSDERSNEFRYKYDLLGRLVDIDVQYASVFAPPGGLPLDRIAWVHYEYDPLDRPKKITAKTRRPNSQTDVPEIVAVNEFAYDGRGNLKTERQAHGTGFNVEPPTIEYAREFSAASSGNYDRLGSIKYPLKSGTAGARRQLVSSYSSTGDQGVNSALGRVTRLTDSLLSTANQLVVSYQYAGSSRVVGQTQGNTVGWAATGTLGAQEVGYPGLDAFGEMADLHYKNGASGATVYRAQYAKDAMGNRTVARVTYAPGSSAAHDNDRSALLGYDALNRLVVERLGLLDTSGTVPSIVPSTASFPGGWRESWTLSQLGTWQFGLIDQMVGGHETIGQVVNAAPVATRVAHATDARNRLLQVNQAEPLSIGSPGPDGSVTPTGPWHYQLQVPVTFDVAGNLVADAKYWYQYDAWNRLVQVNARGAAQFDVLTGLPIAGSTPGAWIVHYTYDGLGRLIRAQRPSTGTSVRSERYFYDGVRRVQGVVHDGLAEFGLGRAGEFGRGDRADGREHRAVADGGPGVSARAGVRR